VVLALQMAGPEVRKRFWTVAGTDEGQLERRPRAGSTCGRRAWISPAVADLRRRPEGFGELAPRYGFPKGKEAHSLWIQGMAEVGVPGIALLFGFFLSTMVLLWRSPGRPSR